MRGYIHTYFQVKFCERDQKMVIHFEWNFKNGFPKENISILNTRIWSLVAFYGLGTNSVNQVIMFLGIFFFFL